MRLSQLDYKLPKSNIANSPITPRDHSRLLVIDRSTGAIFQHHFFELPKLLGKNDVLVFNQTKVFPARLIGKKESRGKVEVLLLKKIDGSSWEAITKPGLFVGDKIYFDSFEAEVKERKNYVTNIIFSLSEKDLFKQLNQIGHVPLPPYIKSNTPESELKIQYQTVYAKNLGSAAAPTAGFHFTKRLLKKLRDKKIQTEYLTLHVGLGTFAPIKEIEIEKHKIHVEYFSISRQTINRLNSAKKEGKNIISVGTTTTRVLESLANKNGYLSTNKLKGHTNLFIYPPYKFKFVDQLITNFHLPKSTLLALVSAFVSFPNTDNKFINFPSSLLGSAYKEAVSKKYRFYSFGDSCFIK